MPPAAPTASPFPTVAKGARQSFWLGVVRGAPFFVLRCSDVTFQQETFAIAVDQQGMPISEGNVSRRNYRDGHVVKLSAKQIATLKERLPLTFVEALHLPDKRNRTGDVVETGRMRSRITKAYRVVNGATERLVPGDDDEAPAVPENAECVMKYLYLLPVSEKGRYGEGSKPPTLG